MWWGGGDGGGRHNSWSNRVNWDSVISGTYFILCAPDPGRSYTVLTKDNEYRQSISVFLFGNNILMIFRDSKA